MKQKQPAIIVDNVSMKFNLSKEKVDSLKDILSSQLKKRLNIMNSGLCRM